MGCLMAQRIKVSSIKRSCQVCSLTAMSMLALATTLPFSLMSHVLNYLDSIFCCNAVEKLNPRK